MRRTVLLLAWPTVGLVVALAVGAVARAAVEEVLRPVGMGHGADVFDWNVVLMGFELAQETGVAAVTGALAGTLIALLGWTTALIWGSNHLFPEGRRVAPVGLTVGAAVVGLLVGGVVLRSTGASGLEGPALAVLLVTVLVASGAVFLVYDRYVAGVPALAAADDAEATDPLEGWGGREA